jgi:hypothetical protein
VSRRSNGSFARVSRLAPLLGIARPGCHAAKHSGMQRAARHLPRAELELSPNSETHQAVSPHPAMSRARVTRDEMQSRRARW